MRARMSLFSFAYTLVMQIPRTILRVEKFLFLLKNRKPKLEKKQSGTNR